ncbi:tRNA (adenosine(37)-N6)-threonylcarbamoyltransferase complex dimerization subunit type 1 TsaB [Enterococcus rivorum]|uniref:tRNA (Adenosine(37)-N6)-threonylcarbamoyltransferase complex dimerization subunit type 1 TsaB n=1 Tax=Enterococcus rivorum TaxID=762845 RepID=A0A1E5KXS0_9ENTE|nr:tRNA (adenosine(37)-N6)-threonylcarbamoyltransferase complex dimerization subunit type 1 TsaB [Enterococcus rivorum]MBP2099772.1 tRNA threonylcarbamoyl adenosine modification protein YeaZ [Enterococcus rivorum]OEH82644.1 tRNA (adenosine(37)-N6)-threonylcarbamoyltransferase complex dimerization subunit type 1 TsaB [Enterococcus rivorum]
MRILAIDTSNQTLSIGVCEDNKILGQYTTTVKKNHSLTLMPAVTELMKNLELTPKEIDRFVVAEGPGSYTGLRIGVTTAKTLAYTLKKELVGISSLATLAANCVGIEGLIIPIFDARRNNVYTGAYEYRNGTLVNQIKDQHSSLEDWLGQLKEYPALYFVGEDIEKFRSQIEDVLPQAKLNDISQWQIPNGAALAQLGRTAEVVKEVHNFLPNYLKKVEAEENWLKNHTPEEENYVEKV